MLLILGLFAVAHALDCNNPVRATTYQLNVTTSPYSITIHAGDDVLVRNTEVLAGSRNTTVKPISTTGDGKITGNDGSISAAFIKPQVVRVQINSSSTYTGAAFSDAVDTLYFGTWEYPFFGKLDNTNVTFDLKGVGDADGINWSNARSQFFISQRGYAVYTDTLTMGSYNYSVPGETRFIFNSSSLIYYIILPDKPDNFKSLLSEYTALSASIQIPSLSGLGPTYWSDDFRVDYHGDVTNDQENVLDVVENLRNNQLRGSSIFLDRPYGTGNLGYGNFDFNASGYSDPPGLVSTLNTSGFDLQLWVANRAFEGSELYNDASQRGWLLPGRASQGGPALDLRIPEAYDYWKERLRYFTSIGIRGYKIDRGEEEEMPVYLQNIQSSLYLRLLYENMIERWNSTKNFYNFARSAVDRSRQHTHVWNGDAKATSTGLRYSVTSGIRAGLVGFPIWGSDTGGYVRAANEPSSTLWARWMWFSAFSPVFEIPVGVGRTPWYKPYTSQLVDVLRSATQVHVELIPYIMSATNEAKKSGVPIIRALFLETPTDSTAYTISDEYFFGDGLLVAPIVDDDLDSREVYFPLSATNTDQPYTYLEYFHRNTTYVAGTTATITAAENSIPVYVRPGAIVPRGDIYRGNAAGWIENWTPYVDVELFPSRIVHETSYTYFDSESEIESSFKLTTNAETKSVTFNYGRTGYAGVARVIGAGDPVEKTLDAEGGELVFEGVEFLF